MSAQPATADTARAGSGLFSRWRGPRRARTDTVLQLEAAECGAASLAMVLSHFGRRVPLEELRIACGVSRDGSKASSLLRAARAYGLEAKGLKAEPRHLRELTMPLIAFVNFNHFLVVEGFRGDDVLLNDPAFGPTQVSREEFDEMFTGVVLTFRRGPDFSAGDSRPSRTASLRQRLSGFETAVLFVFLASLALVIPGIIAPAFSRVFVDYVLVRDVDEWLTPLLLGMLLTAVLRALLTELQTQYLLKAETQLGIQGSSATLWRMLRLPAQFFSQRFAGEIASRLDLNDGLARLLTGELARAALGLLSVVFFFVVMLFYSVTLALITLAFTTLNVVVLLVIMRRLRDRWQRLSVQQGKLHSSSVAGLQDVESFKAAGVEDALFRRIAGLHASVVNTDQQLGRTLLVLQVAPPFLQGLATASVLVVGGFEVMAGELSIGMLVAFQSLMASFSGPAVSLTGFGGQIQQVQAFVSRLDDIDHQPVDARFDAPPASPDERRLPRGRVALVDVSFGYAPLEPPLIDRLDLALRPGARVALVGPSGSGKSTVGRLIAGLYQAREGRVLLDGRPIAHWPPAALAQRVAYVDQRITLFEGSVRENLTLWDPSLPERELIQAAKDAQIHDTIAARAGGYDALVEEDGRNFSGGQRQRLDLARALARNPSVLIMDEATSALDPVTELAIMDAVRRRGTTCVVIAHRLSAIRDCDEIIVLEHGRVVERGKHEKLMASGGHYRALLEA